MTDVVTTAAAVGRPSKWAHSEERVQLGGRMGGPDLERGKTPLGGRCEVSISDVTL